MCLNMHLQVHIEGVVQLLHQNDTVERSRQQAVHAPILPFDKHWQDCLVKRGDKRCTRGVDKLHSFHVESQVLVGAVVFSHAKTLDFLKNFSKLVYPHERLNMCT